jgi:hypothetical protein
LEYIELSWIAGIDPIAAALMGSIDSAPDRLMNLALWQEPAIDVLSLTMPTIVVGNVDGHAPSAWPGR